MDGIGVDLLGSYTFYKNYLPSDSAAPVVIQRIIWPDLSVTNPGTTVSQIDTGEYGGILVAAVDNIAYGSIRVELYTNDPTLDNQVGWIQFDVTDIDTMLAAIKSQTDKLGYGILITQTPVGVDGTTTIIRGNSYYTVDGLALVYTITGAPNLKIATGNAEWHALDANYTTAVIPGDTTAANQVRFELTPTQSRALKLTNNSFSIYSKYDTVTLHQLVTAANTLIVLDSR